MKNIFFVITLFFIHIIAFGQVEEKTKFEIANIHVEGAKHTNEKAIINRSGLKVGQVIELKSYDISNAIKALLGTKLYGDVQIYEKKVIGDMLFLVIEVEELPVLKGFSFKNIKKAKVEELSGLVKKYLIEGAVSTPTDKAMAKKIIEDFYKAKGFLNVEVMMNEMPCHSEEHCLEIGFDILKNKKVKIAEIILNGNKVATNHKLKKVMLSKDKTQLIKSTVFIADNIEMDKKSMMAYYRTIGYRDAKITKERIKKQLNGDVKVYLQIEEGQQYYFRNISWEGNVKYENTLLDKILGIKEGDVFNEQLLYERLHFSQDGRDISSIYMNDGHLFFKAEAIETTLDGQEVDLKIRISEGAQATIGAVRIVGNDITDEAVIRRELRTLPGDKFNRDAIIRSQRALMNLGYFNPETLEAIPNVNPKTGVVDLEFQVEETSNDKFEVSGSWGGKDVGFVGTAGIQLNNFSLKKAIQGEGWRGDGQQLGFQTQFGGRTYQSVNLNFIEPWLGGKKPNRLSFGTYFTNYRSQDLNENGNYERLRILGGSVGYGQRFQLGKEYILANTTLQFQQYRLDEWSTGLFQTDDGQLVSDENYNNLSIKQSFTRTTLNHPIFPTSGSRVSFSLQFTPPYSLFSKGDSGTSAEYNFKWMEYHKWRLDAEKYIPMGRKLTLKLSGKMGFMGVYNNTNGISPFERFQLGGDALSNSQAGFTGIDRITLRGYDVEDLENNIQNGEISATPFFNKFTAEVRLPLSKNPNATMYLLGFAEAGNSYRSFKDYNPFQLKKSAGIGFRAHLPMFGTLGVDYGIGFDKVGERTLKNLGQFSFTLGFELD